MIKFNVNDKIYTIKQEKILNFENDNYLRKIIDYKENGNIGVEVKDDALVIIVK